MWHFNVFQVTQLGPGCLSKMVAACSQGKSRLVGSWDRNLAQSKAACHRSARSTAWDMSFLFDVLNAKDCKNLNLTVHKTWDEDCHATDHEISDSISWNIVIMKYCEISLINGPKAACSSPAVLTQRIGPSQRSSMPWAISSPTSWRDMLAKRRAEMFGEAS